MWDKIEWPVSLVAGIAVLGCFLFAWCKLLFWIGFADSAFVATSGIIAFFGIIACCDGE